MANFEKMVDMISYFLKQQDFPLSVSQYKEKLEKGIYDTFGDIISDNEREYINTKVKEYSVDSSFDSDILTTTDSKNNPWINEKDLDSNFSNPYWKAYESKLQKNNYISNEDIQNIKKEGLSIVSQLVPPQCKKEFLIKGLVYGNVQSGKTASMCAVISQYASLGCKLVIVLSGTTEKLREQTQNRLIKDLCIEEGVDNGCGWKLITNPSDLIPNKTLSLYSDIKNIGNNVIIGVFKKNSAVLKRLNENYLLADQVERSRRIYGKLCTLIIDDECDQASPNVGDDEERSKINEQIVKMLRVFPKCAYIGYTATPFANVLNEAPGNDSLYPASFITMLGEKKNYFGADAIFGLGEEFEEYKDEQDQNLNIIEITENDTQNREKKGKNDKTPPKGKIREAIIYFALATAVKEWRGIELENKQLYNQHSTMMIHTSSKTTDHSDIEEIVKEIIKTIKDEIKNNLSLIKTEVLNVWTEVYLKKRDVNLDAIKQRQFTTPVEDYIIPKTEIVFDLFKDVFNKIELKVDNFRTPLEERLEYPKDRSCYYIVVGGNTLSRGFTLVGLIVTVFTRKVNTYDALLQMGRWFGYRVGYEDLPRLWMPTSILEKFRFLTGIEYDLRNTISRYAVEGATPTDLAIPIRTTPHLQIVRKKAMKGAIRSSINFAGRRPQTIYFENNKEWLENNIQACNKLIESNIHCLSKADEKTKHDMFIHGYLFENISSISVNNFLDSYQFAENSNGLNKELLRKFKDQAEHNYIMRWNLVVKSLDDKTKDETERDIAGLKINLLERGKIDDGVNSDPSIINLKAICSPTDILCCVSKKDIEKNEKYKNIEKLKYDIKFEARRQYFRDKGQSEPGVIIIYPIYAKSEPQYKIDGKSTRIALNAKADVYGVAFVFPTIKRTKDMDTYDSVSIDLSGFTPNEEDEDD